MDEKRQSYEELAGESVLECGLALIETVTTLHTAYVETLFTKSIAEQLAG
jgi:hypothetical protein